MMPATPVPSVGAAVATADGQAIGSVNEVADGAFKVAASAQPDYWLSSQSIMQADGTQVMLGVEAHHLDEFKADSSTAAGQLDALQILLEMHGEAKAKFRLIIDEPDAARAGQMWEELKPELEVHEQMEDKHVYDPFHEEEAQSEVGQYEAQHQHEVDEVNQMIAETANLEPGSNEWRQLITRIRDELAQHIETEEHDIFPRIRDKWDQQRLMATGSEMLQMRIARIGR